MPLRIPDSAPTLLVRKAAFEASGFARAEIDESLGLTDEEFRVEGEIVAIGPIFSADGLADLITELERRGLVYFDDFFELSGNWPDWLSIFAMGRAGGA
jgi:hypothetical protein